MPEHHAAKIDNQDLEHQREQARVNDKGVKVTPPGEPADAPPEDEALQQELELEDRAADETVTKFEESLTKPPPG